MEKNKYSSEVRECVVRMMFERLCEFDSQPVAIKYTERLADAGLEASVGTVGDSYDNALAVTMIGLSKSAVVHRLGP